MKTRKRREAFTCPGVLMLLAALFGLTFFGPSARAEILHGGYRVIRGKTVIRLPLVVNRGSVLYIAPGSEIYIAEGRLKSGSSVYQPIKVYGKLIVDGRPGSPVLVTGGEKWGEIYVDGGVAVIRRLIVEKATWALHLHGGFNLIEDSEFRDSAGGIRMYRRGIYIDNCRLRNNGIGMRYWEGGPVVKNSSITGNRVGIFFREGTSQATFRGNVISNDEYNLKIGDFALAYPDVKGNYWGTNDPSLIMEKVFDGRDEPITIEAIRPFLSMPPLK